MDLTKHAAAPAAPSRRVGLLLLCAGQFMMLLDATIVNVALPTIERDLGFGAGTVALTVNAYLIGTGGFLLVGGGLGDLVGKRRLFVAGLALFVIASLACAGASTPEILVAARFVQGVGGALATSVVLSILVTLFPGDGDRANALGFYGFVVSSGGAAGLLLGGMLTSGFDWRWAFVVNVPIGTAVIAGAIARLPDDRPTLPQPIPDVASAALLSAGMIALVCVILEGGLWGWRSAVTLVAAAGALALLLGFVVRQRRVAVPLVSPRIFRSRRVLGASVAQLLLAAGMFAMFFFLALDLQQQRGFAAWRIGLAFVPASVAMALTALLAASRCIIRLGTAPTLMVGLSSVATALFWLYAAPARGLFATDILPALLLYGVGGGLCFPAATALALSSAAPGETGAVSGLLNTTYQIGGALGLAALSALAAHEAAAGRAAGASVLAALHDGHALAYLVAGVAVLCAVAVTAIAARFGR